jgi:hypothetical protein
MREKNSKSWQLINYENNQKNLISKNEKEDEFIHK